MDLMSLEYLLCKKCEGMKDFANLKNYKYKKVKKKAVFTSKKSNLKTISTKSLALLVLMSSGLLIIPSLLFNTDVISIKSEKTINSVNINFPTSLIEDSVLIELNREDLGLECEYFVQIGAYGNKKYATEALNILSDEIINISINEVYSTLQPGKLLNSVISGPYLNRSAANNAKEKITKRGFEPRLRTLCKEK